MTIRNALLVLGTLLAGNAFAAGTFSIYFNGESSTANCHVDGVSNAQLSTSGSGNLVASAALNGNNQLQFSTACGISSSAQQLTFGPAQPLQGPSATLPAGSNQAGNFTVLPLNATSCTVAITTTSGTGTATGPANGYVCGLGTTPACASSTPIPFSASFTNTAAAASAYQAVVTCQGVTGASPASLTSQVTVNQRGNSGGTPAAGFTFTTSNLTATFTDTSTDPGGSINAWSWNFGDSTTSTVQNPPAHTYAVAGTYNVSLTVTDSVSGAQSTITLPVSVPSGAACTTGATGDVAGYTALCSGTMTLYNPAASTKGPSSYSFNFVFGSAWPGSYQGDVNQIIVAKNQFLSIPFTPTPGHTIAISENESRNGGFPVTFSVSTSMGLFNNGKTGNGVICVQTNVPGLSMTSNGTTGQNCTLSQGTQYWFNIIPASYVTGTGWVNKCTSSTNCALGFGEGRIN